MVQDAAMLQRRRMTGMAGAGIVAGVLLTSACGQVSTPASSREQVVQSTDTNVALKNCAAACTGTIDGAAYTIKLPTHWNGSLLIYSHGYRYANPGPPDFGPVSTAAQVSSTDDKGDGSDPLSQQLLSLGYALAGSSYSSNGWAVADGVKADEALHAKFVSTVGTPKRTYVWGDSLGGLITELVAEKDSAWVDGAAPMCGAVAGPNDNLDLALDVAYAVRQLIDPTLKLTGYSSDADAVANWKHAAAAVEKAAGDVSGGGTAKVLAIAALVDAPTQTETYDGHDLTSQVSARVEAMLTALAYGTSGRYEIEQRVGGDPSQNVGVDYSSRIDAAETSLIEAAGGKMPAILAALDKGPRVTADAAARAKFEALGDTTGKLVVPTVTMHTEADPLVIVQNETVFAARVAKRGDSGLLSQLFVKAPATYSQSTGAPYGAGHCVFSDGQRVALIGALDSWVRGSVFPSAQGLGDAVGPGLDATYTGLPWPAATS
jgi:hypothetical protein